MKILIVEDEQPAARRLIRLVQELLPEIKEVTHLESVEDTVDFFNSGQKTDLAFFDIQLADGLSFDIFSRCKVGSPVIFTTAYDEYALKAFKVNTVDYLLKPIEESELKRALEKYHEIYGTKESVLPDYTALMELIKGGAEKFKKRFLIKTGGRLAFVNVEDIAYFFSDEGTSFLVTQSKDRFILESTLEELESSVNPVDFFRINRKMILRSSSIKKIESHFNNRFLPLASEKPEKGIEICYEHIDFIDILNENELVSPLYFSCCVENNLCLNDWFVLSREFVFEFKT